MSRETDIATLTEATVFSQDGEKVGRISDVYFDNTTGRPAWVTVRTGLFGTHETFVPLAGAHLADEILRVPFDRDTVKSAPRVEANGDLSSEEEVNLFRYYGIDYEPQEAAPVAPRSTGEPARPTHTNRAATERPAPSMTPPVTPQVAYPSESQAGYQQQSQAAYQREPQAAHQREAQPADPREPQAAYQREPQAAGHRQEPEGRASTPSQPSGPRAPRLRRRVVTEMQTITVPVQREEFYLEGPDDEQPQGRGNSTK